MALNIFYQEPDPDRWFPFDRYPRKLIRRIVRGKPRPGGQTMVAMNLIAGLEKLKYPYRFNDFSYAKRHPEELACIIGKPQVLFDRSWKNRILFGASVFSHSIECPDLFEKYPVKKILVPGEWMRQMFEPHYGNKVMAWPVGIDTDTWVPSSEPKSIDVLIYDKVRWKHDQYNQELIEPIQMHLAARKLRVESIRYGHYQPKDLLNKVKRSRAVIFLCEHETQGLAYQQILAAGVPILAWDRGGYWQDPAHFPHRVQFQPVSSVPYWDERCGMKFEDTTGFVRSFDPFWEYVRTNQFKPREYVLENLTLEKAARQYLDIAQSIQERI